ncbi:Hydantoinase/oxoprolinase family protein [Aspergillus niger]|uniref:Hydantoinase/oxoprolinase family protein n=1 Tax=Aspergillus niger TaxID=5061 RepID=A0A505IJN0_ASPNG|nr:Hydantoinase/oxoprolinase family protein [Aspergillus niger]
MIALSSAVVIARFSLIFWKLRSLQVEDGCILLSWACFLAMSIAYIIVTPVVYKIDAYTDGKIGPWATMLSDALFMIKVFFANTMLLWASLWSVKLSFLFLYRRLLQDLPGECSTHRDAVAEIASLYYSFAVDAISDIMIMVLPLRLVVSLRLPLGQKISVAAVFALGTICVIMAVVRVIQIGTRANNDSTPSSSWLAFWGMIEAGIAVIVGCLPAFAIIYRRTKNTHRYRSSYVGMSSSVYVPQDDVALSELATRGENTGTGDAGLKAFNTTPELPMELSGEE